MAKLTPSQQKQVMQSLRLDMITAEDTRPSGPNDSVPPHEAIAEAISKVVAKKLRALDVPRDRLESRAEEEIRRWNHYIAFAFDPRESTDSFYKAHKKDIEEVADYCQDGVLKNQLDRQLIWRFKQLPGEIEIAAESNAPTGMHRIPNPLARAYQDVAVRHNTKLIMGTIGKVLSSPKCKTDLDASYFALDAIETMRRKMATYDPVQTAVSSYMTPPIVWGMLRHFKGNAQERFDRRMHRGLERGLGSGNGAVIEAVAQEGRSAADGFAYTEQGGQVIARLRAAGEKLTGDRTRKIFNYMMDHPEAKLEETGQACGCTKENVRQARMSIGAQLTRLDPELAAYVRAMLNRNAAEMDEERLFLAYEPSVVQKETAALLEEVSRDIERMKRQLGKDNVTECQGEIKISKGATRGGGKLKSVADQLVATYEAAQVLQDIVDSSFVDAGFDVLNIRQIQKLAFYPGGSAALERFVERHIEALAEAGRQKVIEDGRTRPAKLEDAKKLLDRFYESTPDALRNFSKNEVNVLLSAPVSSQGEIPDSDDLLLIRQMGVALAHKKDLQIRF